MSIGGVPAGFYRANRRTWPDLAPEAARRAAFVEWIEERRRRGVTRADACRRAGGSTRSYHRWRTVLRRHGVRALANKPSRPLRTRIPSKRRQVAEQAERLRREHPLGKEKLALLLEREGSSVSASTVGRVLDELVRRGVIQPSGYARRRGVTRRKAMARFHARRKRKDERAAQPGELGQVDSWHEYGTLQRRMHFTAVDPIGRCAHAKIVTRASSLRAKEFLQECLTVWPHPIKSLQVENGSECQGHHELACQELGIELVAIPPATPKANGKAERMQRTFRDEHNAYEPPHLEIEQANGHVRSSLDFYNRRRPHKALNNQTPINYHQPRNPRATPT